MSTNPAIKHHIAYTSCTDLENIMLPYLQKHGMTVFNYYKIYKDKTAIRLSTHQAWTEHYLKNKYINVNKVPAAYLKKDLNYYLWLIKDCPKILTDAAINFDMANGISIAKKSDDATEFFCFGAKASNHSIVNFYLNNLELLQQYSHYFKEKAEKLLTRCEKNKIIIDITGLKSPVNEFTKLSNRQFQCAKLLIQGKTAKEIATFLNLSPRTIESYIDDLKIKLSCFNKTQLVIKLVEMIKHN